jgi:hypothetical protein
MRGDIILAVPNTRGSMGAPAQSFADPTVFPEGWSRCRNLPTASRDVVRFYLVYKGNLAASGNHPKPEEVARIRSVFSPQLEFLWRTHHALSVLAQTAVVPRVPEMRMMHGLC